MADELAALVHGKKIQVRHVYPEANRIETRFVNHVIIQRSPEKEFILSFFEVVPPIILEGSEADLEKIDSVDARCIGRFVFTKERLDQVAKALSVNLTKSESDVADQEQSESTTSKEEKRAAS